MKVEQINQKTRPIFDKYGVVFAGVFGSQARGQAKARSDVDFLVDFKKAPSLVKFIRMENELARALKLPVDVIVQGSEKPLIRANIYRDLVLLYGKRPTI